MKDAVVGLGDAEDIAHESAHGMSLTVITFAGLDAATHLYLYALAR
jgi:hypothetical protein